MTRPYQVRSRSSFHVPRSSFWIINDASYPGTDMTTVTVFTSNGMRGVMGELAPRFEKASGHRLALSYDPGQIMMRRIDAGETADVVILGGSALDDLAKKGRIAAGSRRTYSSCGIGVAVAAGLSKPDV